MTTPTAAMLLDEAQDKRVQHQAWPGVAKRLAQRLAGALAEVDAKDEAITSMLEARVTDDAEVERLRAENKALQLANDTNSTPQVEKLRAERNSLRERAAELYRERDEARAKLAEREALWRELWNLYQTFDGDLIDVDIARDKLIAKLGLDAEGTK